LIDEQAMKQIAPLTQMPAPPRPPLRFLAPGATPQQLVRAVAANHRDWFLAGARVMGAEVFRERGVIWMAGAGEVIIAFPRLDSASASATLDRIVQACRERRPRAVSCWARTPTQPRDLGARLVARGFEWGWQPHWMALDLNRINADIPVPDGLSIEVDDRSEWDMDDLPYYKREAATAFQAHARALPRRTWHFAARLDGRVVGHSLLHVSTGAYGLAGLYSIGVVPSARRLGIGRAVTLAACQFARALGCHYAGLNAATHIYDRIGFVSLGHGQTWWMHAHMFDALPPTAEQVAFAEAVGRGDVKTLDRFDRAALPPDLDAPLPSGLTPLTLAVRTKQPASARWLIAHGATPEIVSLWDLGWKAEAARLLSATPALADRRFGAWQITPLHEAVSRGDAELARLLLGAGPDLTIRDTQFNNTAPGWARHFANAEIIALIEAAEGEG